MKTWQEAVDSLSAQDWREIKHLNDKIQAHTGEWFKQEGEGKYDALDNETALKLITAVIRNDRFCEGALISAFESGTMPQIIDKFVRMNTLNLHKNR